MRSRCLPWAGWATVVAAVTGAAQTRAAADSGETRLAHITYLTSASAYLDAGRLDGLRDSARVTIVRQGVAVAVLQVQYLASHMSSCAILSTGAPLAVGDTGRFMPASTAPDTSRAAPGPVAASPRPGPAPAGLRGRVGVEYLTADQLAGGVGSFTQPGFDLRVDGHPFDAPGVQMSVDMRARRTYTILPDGSAVSDNRNRLYEAHVTVNAPGSPARLTVGRQVSGSLAPVGVFDGLLGEEYWSRWACGVFAGSEPDPIDLNFSTSITEFGLYFQRHGRPGSSTPWAVTLGASDSYDQGFANREFGFLEVNYFSPHVTTLVTEEVDYYRGWKLLPGMSTISPTSTFAILQYRPSRVLLFDAGFDNRRDVRLYQDVVTPATLFDDTFRQGAWVGARTRLGRLWLGVDARASSGGPAGQADAYTLSFGADRVTPFDLTLRTRSTRYVGPDLTGWLHSVSIANQSDERVSVALTGGVRQELNPVANPPMIVWSTWMGFDADVSIARSLYMLLSGTRETGGFENDDELYAGLSVRF